MSAPPQLIVPALWMVRPSRKRVPVPMMASWPPAGVGTLPEPVIVESADQLMAPVAVVARSPAPVTKPALTVMFWTVRLPPTESVPPLTESVPLPSETVPLMAVEAPPGTERVAPEGTLKAPAIVPLLKMTVPDWMSTAPAAGLLNDWLICVVPVVPCLRNVPLLLMVCGAVQPQWL